MKARFSPNALFAAVLLMFTAVASVKAQSNFVLHAFGFDKSMGSGLWAVSTNSDGINPNGWLTLSGTNMYGTAQNGGTNGSGTLFTVSTNGSFRLLYTFAYDNQSNGTYNTTGANPNGGLVLSTTNLYGTTLAGGTYDQGVIFAIGTNGASLKVLYNFPDLVNYNSLGIPTNAGGAQPSAGLVLAAGRLYGTAQNGGSGGNGVIFACTTNRTSPAFTALYQFSAGNYNPLGYLTNNDGANPNCQLLLLGTNLYGTTYAGGTNGYGTIFKVSTNGTGFSVLHHFDDNDGNGDHGAKPYSGLVYSGGTLFGMGGSVAYSLSTNGSGFAILGSFGANVDATALNTSGLTVSNGTLYGVSVDTGNSDEGQVFALTTNGVGFVDFHDFSPLSSQTNSGGAYTNVDGILPDGGMVLLSGLLYGVANQGGANGNGVIFQASPPPTPLSCQIAGTNFLLSFQMFDGLHYTIQQSTNLAGNWTTNSSFAGNSAMSQLSIPMTNSSSIFFRLRQP